LEDANGVDLSQFRRWYDQAGTPVVNVEENYDAHRKRYTLTLSQHTPDTPGQTGKKPFHIPIDAALLDAEGRPMRAWGDGADSGVLELREARQSFTFDVPQKPVPSLLRGFSAPVKLKAERSAADWRLLMTRDTDPFVRWNAGQDVAMKVLRNLVGCIQAHRQYDIPEHFASAFESLLLGREPDRQFQAEMLRLPSETYIAESFDVIDPEAIAHARRALKYDLATRFERHFTDIYEHTTVSEPYRPSSDQIGARALRNCCLFYLIELDTADARAVAMNQFETADNMTDLIAALQALALADSEEREEALDTFYANWQSEPLIVNKWLTVQATSPVPGTLERVQALAEHPAFDIKNPNNVRALIGAFAQGNPLHFHRLDGGSYELVAGFVIDIDRLNPQIAARLAGSFSFWRRYDATRQDLMRRQLERIGGAAGVSRDVREIVTKALARDTSK
jgi:aminopeptidase N